MRLTKKVPARSVTLKIKAARPWVKYTAGFRNVRAGSRRKLDHCDWCKHKFADEELMALAICETEGNKVLCLKCYQEALESENESVTEIDGTRESP